MPREEWTIHYSSNIATAATKDALAMGGLDSAFKKTAKSTKQYSIRQTDVLRKSGTLGGNVDRLRQQTVLYGNKLSKTTSLLKKNSIVQRFLAKSSHTAGLNVGMLSLRIHEGLIPVLFLAYSAILPVVAGLLAIAAAAGVAAIGIGGVLGLGIAAMSMQNQNNNVWGAMNIRSDQGTFDKLLKPLKDAFKAPEIQGTLKLVTELTDDFFGRTLPDTFKALVTSIDFNAIKKLFVGFQTWLPKAATGVSKLGNELYELIGARSIASIGKLFTYLADGLKNTARWLADTGFDDIESFGSILGRFLSKLMELGKVVLPVLTRALESIYPNPIEPVLNKLIDFFGSLSDAEMDKIGDIAKLAAAIVVISTVVTVISGVVGIFMTLAPAITAIASAAGWLLGIVEIGTVAGSVAAGSVAAGVAILIGLGTAVLLYFASVNRDFRVILTDMGTTIINSVILIHNAIFWFSDRLINLAGLILGNDSMKNYSSAWDYWKWGLAEDVGTDRLTTDYNYAGEGNRPLVANIQVDNIMDGEKLGTALATVNLDATTSSGSNGRFPLINTGGFGI